MKKFIALYPIALICLLASLTGCEKNSKELVNKYPEDTLYWHYIQRPVSDTVIWDSIRVVRFGNQVWTAHERPWDNNSNNRPWPEANIKRVTKSNWPIYHRPNPQQDKTALFFRYKHNANYPYHTGYTNWKNDMYNWYAIMGEDEADAHRLCPPGFHVPTASEWDQLEYYLTWRNTYFAEKSGSIANALASVAGLDWGDEGGPHTWHYSDIQHTPGYNWADNNSAHFNVYPTGTVDYKITGEDNNRDTAICIQGAGRMAVYATSTESPAGKDMYTTRIFYYNSPLIGKGALDKSRFARVRCIKDDNTINKTKE